MAHVQAWPSIKGHGLLSTSSLLDGCRITADERKALEARCRKDSVVVHHKDCGEAVIRDNKPMDDTGSASRPQGYDARGMVPDAEQQSIFLVNRKAFQTLLQARAYRNAKHCVIAVKTDGLVADYHDKIWLSPINSGATKPMPHPRGSDTFRRIADYPFDEWKRKRASASKAIAELAVDHGVPNLRDYVENVTVRSVKGIEQMLFLLDRLRRKARPCAACVSSRNTLPKWSTTPWLPSSSI